jgi:predicted P-loop ATPase
MTKISLFPEGYWSNKTNGFVPANKPNENIEFEEYFYRIKNGHWEDPVLNFRAGRIQKIQAPYATPSGTFDYRNVKGLINHSGILVIDVDAKDNPDINIDEVSADPYVYAIHQSISGNGGYAIYIKIEPERHFEAYLGLEKYFANEYHIKVDESCKDVSRMRFVSHDPDAVIIQGSKVFKKYLPKKQVAPRKTYVHTGDDMEFIMSQIKDRSLNLCEDYADWIKVGMAFANHLGEAGRNHFHFISSYSIKYDESKTDKEYDGLLKRKRNDNSIGSFFWLCQQHGIKIKTPKTENIERIAKMRRKSGSVKDPKSDAIKTLEQSGISKEESEHVIDQVMMMPEYEIQGEKSDDLISDLKAFLSTQNMKFNKITRKVEVDGNDIDDRILNSIYIKSKEIVSDKVNKDLLFSIIDSEFTTEYHPFEDFVNNHRHLKPQGVINELLSCIDCTAEYEGARVTNFLETYMQKWLLSVVASMFGTHSEMILVLIGGQGERKTKFFRGLLPDDLQKYYAESKLDEGKDGQILMCEKLIIMDDEFGGKNKQEAKKVKELSSKSIFSLRRPYGKFNEDRKRLAVLCGTSNEGEIINDPTGNRRIIPINVNSIDREKYDSIDKTALWMELYWKWKEIGENWMLTKIEIEYLKEIAKGNEQPSLEEEAIMMFFMTPNNAGIVKQMTNTEIVNYIETRTKLKVSPYKMGLNLKKLGFEKKKVKINGVATLVYPLICKNPD